MRTILDGTSAFERAMIRDRTRSALRTLRAKGKRAGKVPWGYRAEPDGTLVGDEREPDIASRVSELRCEGMTLRGIVKSLASEGRVSRAGKPLALAQVHRIARAAIFRGSELGDAWVMARLSYLAILAEPCLSWSTNAPRFGVSSVG